MHIANVKPKLLGVNGIRSSTAESYIHPSTSPNLTVLTQAMVSRVIIENGRAVGVELLGKRVLARKLVILCCGALGSPTVLERSGVGEPSSLAKAGVDLKVNLPGVGTELDDHQVGTRAR